jgi:hypothetical protein
MHIELVVSVCPAAHPSFFFQFENQLTDFDEILYEHYTIVGCVKFMLFNCLELVNTNNMNTQLLRGKQEKWQLV